MNARSSTAERPGSSHERDAAVYLDAAMLVRSGRAVLNGVDLMVSPGEHWVVLGPNGSGKTSLLQLASAHELPSRGQVWVLGERLGDVDVRQLRQRLGYASTAVEDLVPPRTLARELVVTGKNGTFVPWTDPYDDADWKRADDLLSQMGLEGHGDRRVDTLSSGERRRTQIARSLMTEPELLLLDEPTAGLDLGGREDLVGRLSALTANGPRAMMFVTHHVEEIPPGFSHVALLRNGRVLGAGPIEQVLTSSALSACFDMRLDLQRHGERFFAWQS